MAGELLIPVRVVGALITFLTYLVAFILGSVVTILLLLIYGSVREEEVEKQEPGPKRNEDLQVFNTPTLDNSSSSSTIIPTSNEPKLISLKPT